VPGSLRWGTAGTPGAGTGGPTAPAPPPDEGRDARTWLLLVGTGALAVVVLRLLDVPLGVASPPFAGSWEPRVGPVSLAAPAVAAAVLAAVRAGLHERLPWRPLLGAAWVAAAAWALALALVDGTAGLADPLTAPDEHLADVPRVEGPAAFLRDFVAAADEHTVATRQHPPGPVLLLWGLQRVGLEDPAAVGVVVVAAGTASVPLLGVAVRSLCGELAARRLLPVLVLAPYALWLAVSLDAVVLALAAAFVTAGVLASEHGRRWPGRTALAALAGLLLGVAALLGYSVAWLGISVLAVYFVRRRALLNLVTGASALVPLALAQLAGFVWADGLTAAQRDFSLRVEPERPFAVWAGLNLLLLLVAAGPALVRAARGVRRTPGWPFLVGAAGAVAFATVSGLARGEVERSWLPFFPFLLVAAVAPARRPAAPGDPESSPTPVLLVALGAVTAVVLQAVLRSDW